MQLSLIELIVKGIPEGFLDILAMSVLTGVKPDKMKYIRTSVVFIAVTYLVRLLPINYGVNSLISVMVFVFLFVFLYNVELSKAIKSAIALIILLAVCEGINMYMLVLIFGSTRTQELLSTSFGKSMYCIPSTVMLAFFILVIHITLRKIKSRKGNHGKAGN